MGLFDFLWKKRVKPVEQKKDSPAEKTNESFSKQKQERPLEQSKDTDSLRLGKEKKTGSGQPERISGYRSAHQQQRRSQKAAGSANRSPESKNKNYVVKTGDSLSRIAKQFYGNPNEWQKIYQANKNRIKDPNVITPGQKIIIP